VQPAVWPRTKAPQPVVKRIRRGERRESERGEHFKKHNPEVIMPTNAERLRAIVDRAKPTPQSPGGLNLDLRVRCTPTATLLSATPTIRETASTARPTSSSRGASVT